MRGSRRSGPRYNSGDEVDSQHQQHMQDLSESAQVFASGRNTRQYQSGINGGVAVAVGDPPPQITPFIKRVILEENEADDTYTCYDYANGTTVLESGLTPENRDFGPDLEISTYAKRGLLIYWFKEPADPDEPEEDEGPGTQDSEPKLIQLGERYETVACEGDQFLDGGEEEEP